MVYSTNFSAIAATSAIALFVAPLASAEDGFTLDVFGRVMIDYAIADADNADLDLSASEARRVRIGAKGSYGSNLKYKVEFNTDSSGDVNATDAYLDFKLADTGWNVRAGHFKTPNSFDEANSSRFMSTIERSAFTDAFQLNRRVGVMAHTAGDNYTFSAGVFGENIEESTLDEGYALAARGTYTPVNTDNTLLHLGASVRYRDAGGDGSNFRYRQRPYTHIPSRVISTGNIAESDTFYGVEALGMFGQAWATGEYAITNADISADGDADLEGFYLEAGYFFGGKRVYKKGKFDRPKVANPITDGGLGALSLIARYDSIDLTDSIVDGGELETIVLGADWWPTKNTRIALNYFNGDVAYGSSTSGLDSVFAAQVTAGTEDDEVNGVVARLYFCLLYTSPSPRDATLSRMPSSA